MNFEAFEPQLYMIFKMVVSAVCGGAIGYFRRRKGVGIRTISLVSIGTTLFTLASIYGFPGDEARIAAGIVTGIGFLGAGVIWKHEKIIGGITTATSIWVASAIGLAVALEMWSIVIFTVILTVAILRSNIDEDIDDTLEIEKQKIKKAIGG